jgi:ankyrin repeat protein
MANRRQAIALLVSEWPEQLNIVDFKRQSASMFAAQQRDSETLQMLLKAGADVNLQDYTGSNRASRRGDRWKRGMPGCRAGTSA